MTVNYCLYFVQFECLLIHKMYLYSLEISWKSDENNVELLSVTIHTGRYREDSEYCSFRKRTQHGGHRGGNCHQSHERCQQRVHAVAGE